MSRYGFECPLCKKWIARPSFVRWDRKKICNNCAAALVQMLIDENFEPLIRILDKVLAGEIIIM